MQELPTNNFLFENTQDFSQTTYVGPQDPIVFIDNICLYFNCLGSVQNVFKMSWNGHIMGVGCQNSDFLVECSSFYAHFISLLFFNMTESKYLWDLKL